MQLQPQVPPCLLSYVTQFCSLLSLDVIAIVPTVEKQIKSPGTVKFLFKIHEPLKVPFRS